MFARLYHFVFIALLVGAVSAIPLKDGYNSCTTPAVRKEWRALTGKEQSAFLSAVKCLATVPHNTTIGPDGSQPDVPPVNATSNRYDDFVFTHMDGVIRNHFTGGETITLLIRLFGVLATEPDGLDSIPELASLVPSHLRV
jgi:hypothetical protein